MRRAPCGAPLFLGRLSTGRGQLSEWIRQIAKNRQKKTVVIVQNVKIAFITQQMTKALLEKWPASDMIGNGLSENMDLE